MSLIKIKIPDFNNPQSQGVISDCLKKIGDFVKKNEVLCKIKVDNAVLNLQVPAPGTLVQFLVKDGDTVSAKQIVAYLKPLEKTEGQINTDKPVSIPTNQAELKQKPKIDIREVQINSKKYNFEQVYRLEISTKIPTAEAIAKLPNVMEVEARYLPHIPKHLFNFPKLKVLTFYDCKIDEIYPEIGFLQDLEVLRFDVCEFFLEKKPKPRTFWEKFMGKNEYPVYEPEPSLLQICNLLSLKELAFKDRPIYEFPEDIYRLENLESLAFQRTELQTLPESLQYLQNFKKIAIGGNYTALYSQIFEVLGKCKYLEEVNISELRKEEIVLDINFLKNLPKLRVLEARNTFVKNIEVLNELPYVEKIDLSRPDTHYYKKGITVPSDWLKLKNLKELDLRGNKNPQLLTKIGKNIAQWEFLEKLDLSNCELTTIPEEIGELSRLTYLNLGENDLTELPHTFDYLTNIKTLNLKDCKIHPKYINRFREIMPKVRIILE